MDRKRVIEVEGELKDRVHVASKEIIVSAESSALAFMQALNAAVQDVESKHGEDIAGAAYGSALEACMCEMINVLCGSERLHVGIRILSALQKEDARQILRSQEVRREV